MYQQRLSGRRSVITPKGAVRGRLSTPSLKFEAKRFDEPIVDIPKSIGGISIPGFERIVNSNGSSWKRIIWTILIGMCIALCIWLLQIRLSYYLSKPTMLDSKPVWNKTVVFPAITLCPVHEPFENDTIHYKWLLEYARMNNQSGNVTVAAFEDTLFDNLNFTLDDLWMESYMRDEQIKVLSSCTVVDGKQKCNFHEGLETTVKNSSYDTFWGRCRLFIPELPMDYRGPSTFFTIALKGYNHNKTHGPNGIKYTAQYIIHEHDTIHRHDAYLLPACLCAHWLNTVEMGVKQFHYLNKPNAECGTVRQYSDCYNYHLDQELTKILNCRLPFLHNSTLPLCNSWRAAKEAHVLTKDFYNSFKFDTTKCKPKCDETTYVKHLVKMKMDDRMDTTLLNLEFADNQFEEITEKYVYDLTVFLGDATAFLGFFLGICILSVFEMVESMFDSIINCRGKNKQDNFD